MTQTYHQDDRCWLMRGDNIDALRLLEDASIDAIVSDVPYGLGEPPDALDMLAAWLSEAGRLEVGGKGFMGKEWDSFVPQPALWRECLRVLKPGGYLLSFAGTRTMDLVGLGLRIAGFEIRDTIRYMGELVYPAWIFGSGFPKSMDIAKAIDKRLKVERLKIGSRKHAPKFNARQQGYRQKDNGFNRRSDERQEFDVTAPASNEAKQWDGWGTALKPAWEPIIVARKPPEGSTVGNVLKHGVGGINIAACRVGTDIMFNHGGGVNHNDRKYGGGTGIPAMERGHNINIGRWPANVIHDGSPAILREFAAFGEKPRGGSPDMLTGTFEKSGYSGVYGDAFNSKTPNGPIYSDTGTAARFFYCAKASKMDRDEGLTGEPGKYSHDGRATPIENAYQRNASEAINRHPTVKPTALMRWCVRLVTPPGGTVLDMYMGSGSTGKAAMLEGFKFIGIDLDMDGTYLPIATGRIIHAQKVLAKMPAGLKQRSSTKASKRATLPAAGQMALELEDCPALPPAPPTAQQRALNLVPWHRMDAIRTVWHKIQYHPMTIFPRRLTFGVTFRQSYTIATKVACIGNVCKLLPWPILDRFAGWPFIDD